jgi:hypothetical protein
VEPCPSCGRKNFPDVEKDRQFSEFTRAPVYESSPMAILRVGGDDARLGSAAIRDGIRRGRRVSTTHAREIGDESSTRFMPGFILPTRRRPERPRSIHRRPGPPGVEPDRCGSRRRSRRRGPAPMTRSRRVGRGRRTRRTSGSARPGRLRPAGRRTRGTRGPRSSAAIPAPASGSQATQSTTTSRARRHILVLSAALAGPRKLRDWS